MAQQGLEKDSGPCQLTPEPMRFPVWCGKEREGGRLCGAWPDQKSIGSDANLCAGPASVLICSAPHWLPPSQEVTVALPVTWGHDTMDYITPHHPTVEDRLFFRR